MLFFFRKSCSMAVRHFISPEIAAMSEETLPASKRAKARAATKERRAKAAALRQGYFNALASGFTAEEIAEASHASVRTVRREIDRTLDERRLDSPERYAHLQVARLTKALRLADARIEQGDLAAVGPLATLVAALDRYHGLCVRSLPAAGAAPAWPALPPPPLALTHAAPPLADAEAPEAENASQDLWPVSRQRTNRQRTDFGA
jgi:AraC-like DNA-binding protein